MAEVVVAVLCILLALGIGALKYKTQTDLRSGKLELESLIASKRTADQELQALVGTLSQVDLKERGAVREYRRLVKELTDIQARLQELDEFAQQRIDRQGDTDEQTTEVPASAASE